MTRERGEGIGVTEAQGWLVLAVLCTLGLGTGRDTWIQLALAFMALVAYVAAVLV